MWKYLVYFHVRCILSWISNQCWKDSEYFSTATHLFPLSYDNKHIPNFIGMWYLVVTRNSRKRLYISNVSFNEFFLFLVSYKVISVILRLICLTTRPWSLTQLLISFVAGCIIFQHIQTVFFRLYFLLFVTQ